MIDETHLAELLAAPDDDAALILLEGRAQVVDAASLTQEDHAGAAVLLTRAELVDRLGTATPAGHEVRLFAQTLSDTAGKLGA